MNKSSQLRQRAQGLLKKGQLDKALEEYRRLLQMDAKNPNLYNEVGDIYLKVGDRIQAVSHFERAALLYEKVALYNNAVAVCKKILRVVPNRLDTIFKLGEIRAKQKFEGEAGGYFCQFLDTMLAESPDATEGLQEKVESIIELLPHNSDIHVRAADVFSLIGMKMKACEVLAALISRRSADADQQQMQLYKTKLDSLRSSLSRNDLRELDKILPGLKGGAVSPQNGADARGQPATPQPPTDQHEPVQPQAAAAHVRQAAPEHSRARTAETREVAGSPAPQSGHPVSEDQTAASDDSTSPPSGASASTQGPASYLVEDAVDESEMIATMDMNAGHPTAAHEASAERSVPGKQAPCVTDGNQPERQSASRTVADELPGNRFGAVVQEVADAATGTEADASDRHVGSGPHPTGRVPANGDDFRAPSPPQVRVSGDASTTREFPADGSRGSIDGKDLAKEITSDVEEEDYRSHYDLGMAYIEMALYSEAVKELQVAARSEKLQLRSLEMIGHCFLQQNNPRLAVKQLLRGLEKMRKGEGETLGIHYNLGLAYEALGEMEKAREHFEEVYIVDVTFRDVAQKMDKYSTIS